MIKFIRIRLLLFRIGFNLGANLHIKEAAYYEAKFKLINKLRRNSLEYKELTIKLNDVIQKIDHTGYRGLYTKNFQFFDRSIIFKLCKLIGNICLIIGISKLSIDNLCLILGISELNINKEVLSNSIQYTGCIYIIFNLWSQISENIKICSKYFSIFKKEFSLIWPFLKKDEILFLFLGYTLHFLLELFSNVLNIIFKLYITMYYINNINIFRENIEFDINKYIEPNPQGTYGKYLEGGIIILGCLVFILSSIINN